MIKKKIIRQEIDEEIIEDVICNKCGKSTLDKMKMNYECAILSASWGFSSKKDMQSHKSHLCESCYDNIVESFEIPTEIEGYKD